MFERKHYVEEHRQRGEGWLGRWWRRLEKPQATPESVTMVLEAMPQVVLERYCGNAGHPSYWLLPGYRYGCVCGGVVYKD